MQPLLIISYLCNEISGSSRFAVRSEKPQLSLLLNHSEISGSSRFAVESHTCHLLLNHGGTVTQRNTVLKLKLAKL
jgi:hypothetical protein